MIWITETLALNESAVSYVFIRSRGPGGQHVNRSATGVQLRFDLGLCHTLPAGVRQRLARIAGGRISRDGVLVIEATCFRSQHQNRQDALDRLAMLIRRAATPVAPRRATRPTAAARQRRLTAKRRRGALKQARKRPSDADA